MYAKLDVQEVLGIVEMYVDDNYYPDVRNLVDELGDVLDALHTASLSIRDPADHFNIYFR